MTLPTSSLVDEILIPLCVHNSTYTTRTYYYFQTEDDLVKAKTLLLIHNIETSDTAPIPSVNKLLIMHQEDDKIRPEYYRHNPN